MKKKIIEREVNTYAVMWQTSSSLFDLAAEHGEHSTDAYMASMCFAAFTLEAYLNHILKLLFQCWEDLEQLRPKEKLNLIAEKMGIEIRYGERPWQTIKDVFKVRNELAHGKPVTLRMTLEDPDVEYTEDQAKEELRTIWEKDCTQANVARARADVERILRTLHEKANIPGEDPFSPGQQSIKITETEEE